MFHLDSVTTRSGPDRPIPALEECAVVVLADVTQAIADAVKAGGESGWWQGYALGIIGAGAVALLRGWLSDNQVLLDFGGGTFAVGLVVTVIRVFRHSEVKITMPHWPVVDFAARWQAKLNQEVKGG